MSDFLANAAAAGIQPMPSFESTTVFPTSVSAGMYGGQETAPLNTKNSASSVSGAGVLSFLGSAASLFLGYKTAEAQLKAANAAAAAPAAVPAPAGSGTFSMSPEAKKWLLWGGIGVAVLLVIGLLRRR